MKKLLIGCLLLICAFTIAFTCQPKTWEYKFEYKIGEKKANEYAAQGWELVTIGTDQAGNSTVPFMVFRRAR